MKTLTKSLHTVTAAVNVARLMRTHGITEANTGAALAADALAALGYQRGRDYQRDDVTYQRIVAQCDELLNG
jgi:hypothetical protein